MHALAIAAAAALLLSGCSPEAGWPAVHDMPAPRADTPLTPDQIKQATEELATERDHLATATQAKAQQNSATRGKPAAEARKKPAPAASSAGQTAGADPKP